MANSTQFEPTPTFPSLNSIFWGSDSFSRVAATGRIRSFNVSIAFRTAAPLRSVPEEAAVAEVLGTLSVAVVITRTRAGSSPSSCAAIVRMLVWIPCPISVPPWFTCTDPSL